nr:hypothetical protein [Leptospira alexanderi]
MQEVTETRSPKKTKNILCKDKWAFTALERLGGYRIAFKLTPLIKVWPEESRAVLGLEILKTIGPDIKPMVKDEEDKIIIYLATMFVSCPYGFI